MTGEIWLLIDAAPDARLRRGQCSLCRKYHLREGVIAFVLDHPFADTRKASLVCAKAAGYTVPEWRKDAVRYEVNNANAA